MKLLYLDLDLEFQQSFVAGLHRNKFGVDWEVIVTSKQHIFEELYNEQHPDCLLIGINTCSELISYQRLLTKVLPLDMDIPVVVLTSLTQPFALAQMRRLGASECLSKDLPFMKINYCLSQHVTQKAAEPENSLVQLFAGKTLQKIAQKIRMLSTSRVRTILVTGESGTGKELVADLVRKYSSDCKNFITINCASIQRDLIQSELFGHKKGSFTGANQSKLGLIPKAHGGWVFLDELGRLPVEAQASLLRVIENQQVRPVGSNDWIDVDVRFVAATNENLAKKVQDGSFREDFLQRLLNYKINIPPLRHRSVDERAQVMHFLLQKLNGQNKHPYTVTPDAHQMLMSYNWSRGNIREMWNVLQQAMVNSVGDQITVGSLPIELCTMLISQELENPHQDPYEDSRPQF